MDLPLIGGYFNWLSRKRDLILSADKTQHEKSDRLVFTLLCISDCLQHDRGGAAV